MKAYEFNTVIHGGLIRIPKEFSDEKLSWVRVILLSNPEEAMSQSHQNKFSAMRLKTKGFIFNREEIHER